MKAESYLFDVASLPTRKRQRYYKTLQTRVWTHTKSQFIARYLKLFVMITKHGTYLDAFAGPQDLTNLKCWTARLVLANRPRFLKHFVLCEKSVAGIKQLNLLKAAEPAKTDIRILPGNSNETLVKHLSDFPIKEKEATFCLFDQRTFECDWDTVRMVASHKASGKKIELLYFLMHNWFPRAVSNLKVDRDNVLRRWMGPNWEEVTNALPSERPVIMARRFREELGYEHASFYPIFKKGNKTQIMFYLVHGSDHEEAPALMARAYNNEMKSLEGQSQGHLNLGDLR